MYTLYDTLSKTIIHGSFGHNTINYYLDILDRDMYLPVVNLMVRRTVKHSSWSHIWLDGKVAINVR